MAWKILAGREGQFFLQRNGNTLKAELPKSRVYDEEIGVFSCRIDISKQDYAISQTEGGFIGMWRHGEFLYAVYHQPGHSQTVGERLKIDGRSRVTSSANNTLVHATDAKHTVPAEIKALLT